MRQNQTNVWQKTEVQLLLLAFALPLSQVEELRGAIRQPHGNCLPRSVQNRKRKPLVTIRKRKGLRPSPIKFEPTIRNGELREGNFSDRPVDVNIAPNVAFCLHPDLNRRLTSFRFNPDSRHLVRRLPLLGAEQTCLVHASQDRLWLQA